MFEKNPLSLPNIGEKCGLKSSDLYHAGKQKARASKTGSFNIQPIILKILRDQSVVLRKTAGIISVSWEMDEAA